MNQQLFDPVSTICELAEAIGDRFRAAELIGRYGTSLQLLTRLGAIEPGTPLGTVTCRACYGDHPATVEFDAATRRHLHFCPEAGLVTVDDADLATLRFNPLWLVEWLVCELPITPPVRRRPLVPGHVWHLGDARCGETLLTVMLARQVCSQAALDQLASVLKPLHPADYGLVITTSADVTRQIPLPNRFKFLDIREIVSEEDDELTLNKARLASWVLGMNSTPGIDAPGRSGRPSSAAHIIRIYRDRRSHGQPVVSTRAEAMAIRDELAKQAPDQRVPDISTVRRHVARARSEATAR